MNVYREAVPLYEDVRDWDVVIVHGYVRIVGKVSSHLSGCAWEVWGRKCGCFDNLRFSSPLIDDCGREFMVHKGVELRIRDGVLCRDFRVGDGASPLLGVGPGSELRVFSGKTYRLVGPRMARDSDPVFSVCSIWRVYAEPEKEIRAAWWTRLAGAMRG